MNFKMAPELGLRDPAALALVDQFHHRRRHRRRMLLLLPAHLAPFAAMGAAPIAVIGCIAAWRQWRAPSATRVQATLGAGGRDALARGFAALLTRA